MRMGCLLVLVYENKFRWLELIGRASKSFAPCLFRQKGFAGTEPSSIGSIQKFAKNFRSASVTSWFLEP